MKCDICDVELIEGNPGNFYGTLKGKNYISRHHFFPKRFIKFFTEGEVKKNLELRISKEKPVSATNVTKKWFTILF